MSDTSSVSSDTSSLVTTSTRTFVSGTSGFDSSSLIEAAVEAKLQPAYTLEAKVDDENLKLSAYNDLDSLLGDMQDALDVLRNAAGTTGTDSVFDEREAYLTASDGSTANNYMGLTVDNGVEPATYEVGVQQIATTNKVGGNTVATEDEALGLDGSFTIGTDAGGSATITVTADMTLSDIKDSINAASGDSGVNASILQVDDGSYMLILTSAETGETISFETTSGDDIGQSLGLTDTLGAFTNILQEAQVAIFTVDGITVQRSSNSVDDVLEGITFDLYAASDATFTVEIANDYSDAKDAITAFVDAYNAYRDFVLTQQDVDSSGTPADDAYLFGDSTLRSVNSAVYDALTSYVEVDGSTFSIGNLGLSFDTDNHLTYDEDDLDEALIDNIDAVASLFELQFTSTDSDVQILSHDGALTSGSYALDVTVDGDGNITSASWDGDDSLFEINGSRLVGKDGTAVEGLTLVYSGGESTSATVTLSQGLGDTLYDTIAGLTDTDGALTTAIDQLEDKISDQEDRISDLQDSATDYQEYLIDYYASLEAKINASQSLLTYLKTLTSSSDD